MELLELAGLIIGGFFVAQIAQRIFVPILVQMLGAQHFAAPTAFDGCTLAIVGMFVTPLAALFLSAKRAPIHAHPAWALLIIAVGITLYGLAWLWMLGRGGHEREWSVEAGRIVGRDGAELRPSSVRERSNYFQTDAFSGYSHYFLELYDEENLLATNAYTSNDERAADLQRVREAGAPGAAPLRSLDLTWLNRIEPRVWRYARFPDSWTPILCGSLDRLGAEDAEWWHEWTMPQFVSHLAREVDVADATTRVERLRTVYPELQTPPDNLDIGRCWADFNFDLDALLSSHGAVIAVDEARFQQMAHEATGDRAQMLYDLDGLVKLR